MNTENIESVEGEVVTEGKPNLKKTAVKAIRKGSTAAKKAAANVAVAPAKIADRVVFGTCYGVAYGVVYAALVVGKIFPENGAVRKGLHEGLESAVKDFDAKQHETIVDAVASA
ncbi:hypothetical protein [Methylomonas sp. MgM2]